MSAAGRPRAGRAGCALGLALLAGACGPGGEEAPGGEGARSFPTLSSVPFTYAGPVLDVLSDPEKRGTREQLHETEVDWAIARGTVEWGLSQDLDLLPIGEVAAILGSTFVGAAYEPGTLELPGPERLVVNLAEFDCVTFVEHMLALARLVVEEGAGLPDDEEAFRARYRDALRDLRYRGGVIDGYPSRLHYFSEWIRDAEAGGWLVDVTPELGGIRDDRPVHFMSSNPDAYRQLGEDPAHLDAIRRIEARISRVPRYYVPQERIAGIAPGIRNGDVIAAVSTVDGLDVAHTGLAFWHGGRLHLLHAPLVGEFVEISRLPLAERILGIEGQKGIIVARPLDPRDDPPGAGPSGEREG